MHKRLLLLGLLLFSINPTTTTVFSGDEHDEDHDTETDPYDEIAPDSDLEHIKTHVNHLTGANKNILMIVVDDLRPGLRVYGHKQAISPNIDKFATEGVTFTKAFTQYSYCAPSRNAFMSGRRPDVTKAWNFLNHFRDPGVGTNWTALPQHFKNSGFISLGAGKLYHPDLPPHYDGNKSWTGFGKQWPYYNVYKKDDHCTPEEIKQQHTNGSWCAQPDNGEFGDRYCVKYTKQHLRFVAQQGKPFFVGAGFHRPHMPWSIPAKFVDMYNGTNVLPPKFPDTPEGMPPVAWHSCNDGAGVTVRPATQPLSLRQSSEARKYYLAATAFTDDNIGQLLNELDSLGLTNSTAVVFFADHGWQLGEHNEWCKMTNFELGVKVPMIFRVPWIPQRNKKTAALAELVDVYPTLSDLVDLPLPNDKTPLGGVSLKKAIENPDDPNGVKDAAFSQMARCYRDDKGESTPGTHNDRSHRCDPGPTNLHTLKDMCDCHWIPRGEINYMGYTIRTQDWRYTEWVQCKWNGTYMNPIWSNNVGYELYDHLGDDGSNFDKWENVNQVDNPKYKSTVLNLRGRLRTQFTPPGMEWNQ